MCVAIFKKQQTASNFATLSGCCRRAASNLEVRSNQMAFFCSSRFQNSGSVRGTALSEAPNNKVDNADHIYSTITNPSTKHMLLFVQKLI